MHISSSFRPHTHTQTHTHSRTIWGPRTDGAKSGHCPKHNLLTYLPFQSHSSSISLITSSSNLSPNISWILESMRVSLCIVLKLLTCSPNGCFLFCSDIPVVSCNQTRTRHSEILLLVMSSLLPPPQGKIRFWQHQWQSSCVYTTWLRFSVLKVPFAHVWINYWSKSLSRMGQ